MLSLLKDAVITKVSNGAGAGTSEVDSSILDMAGFDSVMFIVDLGTVTDASVLTLTPQHNTANSTAGMAAITGAAAGPFTAATSSNTQIVSDTFRPVNRYVRAAFTRTAQNAVVNSIIAIQYNARALPVTQPTTMIASQFVAAQ